MIKYEDCQEIFKNKKEFNLLVRKASELKSFDKDLIISDFDDTIFSRDEQKEKSKFFKRYSNLSSTEVVFKHYGLDEFINIYFKDTSFPDEISSQLRENHDLILTAGRKELQEAKLRSINLDKINHIIVDNPINKILELIKYIILYLKYIPSSITIYEDKIEYFIEYKTLIESFFNTEINIIEVKMNGNNGYLSLTKK